MDYFLTGVSGYIPMRCGRDKKLGTSWWYLW